MDVSEYVSFEQAQRGGLNITFDEQLCDILDMESGDECDIKLVDRNGELEIEIEPDVATLTAEQRQQLEQLATSE